MRIALGVLLSIHAFIHLMGFFKAFGFAELPQLALPISKPLGFVWLGAMVTLFGAAVALWVAPRAFWLLGAVGVVASQIAIVASWSDAKFGTAVNLVVLVAVVQGAFARGPFGLHAEYEAAVRRSRASMTPMPVVSEADLARLPAPIQRYLRFVGVVGHPRVRNFRVRFAGRIRSAADAPWMEFTAHQLSLTERPTRLFMMDATMKGLPVDVFHSYVDAEARMRVKVLSLYPMVDVRGPALTRTETVTVFNDLCVMAPAALIDPAIGWTLIDDRTVEATYTNAGHTIRATLYFDDSGALVNFTSDDRPALAPDGKTFIPQRWSTPVTGYRAFGAFRLASRGEACYAPPSGEYAYGEFDLEDVAYNVAPE